MLGTRLFAPADACVYCDDHEAWISKPLILNSCVPGIFIFLKFFMACKESIASANHAYLGKCCFSCKTGVDNGVI